MTGWLKYIIEIDLRPFGCRSCKGFFYGHPSDSLRISNGSIGIRMHLTGVEVVFFGGDLRCEELHISDDGFLIITSQVEKLVRHGLEVETSTRFLLGG